jgi:hypothetical protein
MIALVTKDFEILSACASGVRVLYFDSCLPCSYEQVSVSTEMKYIVSKTFFKLHDHQTQPYIFASTLQCL